jgi:hypothetical protein
VAAAEAKKAAEKRRLELLAKVERKFFSADRDSDCTGRGLPPYRWEYSGGTFAEDAELAALDGCRSPYSYQGNTTFCCPRAPGPWGF